MRARTTEKCSICGGSYYAKGLCKFHYQRQRNGVRQDMPRFKKYNDYEIHGDIVHVFYENKNREKIGYFVIDKEDLEKIKHFKWSIISSGYIASYPNNKMLLLHRFLTDCPEDKEVDHINHNKLNYRRCNLRVCTHRQNNLNKKSKSNTGEYGISFSKGYYHICVNKKYCGISKDFEEAKRIRDANLIGTEVKKYNYYLD